MPRVKPALLFESIFGALSFSNRYERSTNTRALVDFNELKPLVTNSGTSNPSIFNDKQHPLPRSQELIAAGWPKKKDRVARAILALALKKGGLDLADGSMADRSNLAKREYHHLFPITHLRDLNFSDDDIYRSLNCSLVTWRTNRTISSKEPERYLAERRDGTTLGEDEVRGRLTSHLIPYNEMVDGDYNAFLNARATLIEQAMNELCTRRSKFELIVSDWNTTMWTRPQSTNLAILLEQFIHLGARE